MTVTEATASTEPAPPPAATAASGWAAPVAAAATAGLSLLAWLIADPRTPDLAAAVYRHDLFGSVGFTVWDNNWYSGHHIPGYSLLFDPLAALLGLRGVAVLAVLASSVLFAVLARRHFAARAAVPASVVFAVAASGDAWIGRLTFALGVSLGLAAVLAVSHRRIAAAALLAGLCSAASPVAGLFLVLAGVAHLVATRRPARGLALALPALAVAVAMTWLFPEGGNEPFPASSFIAALAAALAVAVLMPRQERTLRVGAGLYVVAVIASLIVPGPMGSNVDRLGVLFGLPLLIGARLSWPPVDRRPRWSLVPIALVAAGLGVWVLWGPVREGLEVRADPSVNAAYYAPLERFLAGHLQLPARVEVPLTRSHWEAALLAERFPLARGWERQLDTRYNGLFFGGPLTAQSYEAWLRANSVRYVALPDVPLDSSSRAEARLLRAGAPYLRPVFTSTHWRVWEVLDAAPLARGPGELTALGRNDFTLRVDTPGRFTVQIHYTRYWTVTEGRGCVRPAPGGWTTVRAQAPGTLRVTARFSVKRALGVLASCPAG